MELSAEQRQAIEQQKEHCPFCQIVAGKIPAQKVYEDDRIIAVLDINPARKGHVLVLPKEHYPIMPLIPPEEFEYLFDRVREVTRYVREAMVCPKSTVFIANGQAAGQQSTHFLVHVIPSDDVPQNFILPEGAHDDARVQEVGQMLSHNLPIMLRERSANYPAERGPDPTDHPAGTAQEGAVSDLAMLIEQNPELREMIKEKPDAVLEGLKDNPSLKPLFEGVDVHALSEKLKAVDAADAAPTGEATQAGSIPPPSVAAAPAPEPAAPAPQPEADDVPVAMAMTDDQLRSFIDGKPALRDYLLSDLDALRAAIPAQPRLQRFFASTSPEAVRDRYNASESQERGGRRFGGGS